MGLLDWLNLKVTTVTLDGDGNFVHEDAKPEGESGENPFGGKWGWLIEMAAISAKNREEAAERKRMENAQYAKTGTYYRPDYQAASEGMSWMGRSWGRAYTVAECDKDTYADGT